MSTRSFARFVRDQALTIAAALSITLLVIAIASRASGTGYFGTIRFGASDTNTRSLGFNIASGGPLIILSREQKPSASAVHYGLGIRNPRASDWSLRVPFWLTMPLLSLLPTRFVWLYYHQNRRKPPGACPHCGYDLRATPHRCPECGAACKAADPAGVSPAAGN